MANNNRVFYGSQVAQLKPSTTGVNYGYYYQPLGVQSVGFTSTFDTEQTFQLGALDIYSIAENVPNVEVTMSKVLDGTCPLYLMCMGGQSGIVAANLTGFTDDQMNNKGLGALANNTVNFRLGIYNDTKSNVAGTTTDWVQCSGMYLSSLSFTFPVDGNATEEVTLVGNNKKWSQNSAGAMGTMTAVTPTGEFATAKKLARRQYINVNGSVMPTGSGGLPTGLATNIDLHLQNITISADLGRDQINELGSFAPYHRYATFPIEVTSEFEIIATEGDYISANDFLFQSGCGVRYTNINTLPIRLQVCGSGDGTLDIFLGSGNQLTSVNYTGGDTGGGNASVSYSFRNYNDFYMKAVNSYSGVPKV
jgi:hypothetical protein